MNDKLYYVRDKTSLMVFPVDGVTFNATGVSYYDCFCYSDPRPDVRYIEFEDWNKARSLQEWYDER